jgi:hypothetical protein
MWLTKLKRQDAEIEVGLHKLNGTILFVKNTTCHTFCLRSTLANFERASCTPIPDDLGSCLLALYLAVGKGIYTILVTTKVTARLTFGAFFEHLQPSLRAGENST